MPIIREDMAVMIAKAMEAVDKPLPGYSNSILETFKDKNHISLHAIASIASLYGEGIIKGKGENTLAPKESATRAEAAVMLYRALEKR